MAPVLQPGQRIDDTYELLAPVAAGGVGQVWKARGPSGMPVAVKFLRSAHDPRLDRLLAREIAHTARLSHPHIVDILARGTFGEHRYAVLEWMQGGTLTQLLPVLSLPDIVQALQAVLAALAHAHGRRLLHLDVKPDNIMCATVRPDWRLVDFGIARHLGRSGPQVAGTPRYMAPEQQHGHGLGPATDLYALGITAWELLHGTPPYHGPTSSCSASTVPAQSAGGLLASPAPMPSVHGSSCSSPSPPRSVLEARPPPREGSTPAWACRFALRLPSPSPCSSADRPCWPPAIHRWPWRP